jgi:hypothetical protein
MRERTVVGERRPTHQGLVCPAEGRLRARLRHACPDAGRGWCQLLSLQALCALRGSDSRLG